MNLRIAVSGFIFVLVGGCGGGEPDVTANDSGSNLTAGFVEYNGGRIYFQEKGVGRPLVLIHSANTNLHIWDDQFEVFSNHFRTVRYDGRGFGRSQSESVDFSDYEDLHALLDSLELEKSILVGLSLGGMTALEFALEHPERVSALVLAGTGLNGYPMEFSEADLSRFGEVRNAAKNGDFETAATLISIGYLDAPGRPWTQVDTALCEKLRGMVLQSVNRFSLTTAGLHHFLDPPAIGRLKEVNVPTLVILGEHESPNEYGIADLLEANIPDLTRVVIPDSKHLTSMENPIDFNRELTEFLARLEDGPESRS